MGTNKAWVNSYAGSPKVEGTLEISTSKDGVWIAGDPIALRSLAKLIVWLADVNQESQRGIPVGERIHVHLYPNDPGFNSLTGFSENTEICRLDAKGTGQFPEKYQKLKKRTGKKISRRRKQTKSI
jgi:hypothetical protein